MNASSLTPTISPHHRRHRPSQDHRIVAHDSALNTLFGTMFALDDLVTAFRESSAGFVLVILDCCFGFLPKKPDARKS
jgi:hypothetical protein